MSVSMQDLAKLTPRQWAAMGAYASPFSGTAVEFEGVGGAPEASGVVLHETGFLQRRPHWDYQNVFSPFWRLYWDPQPGHHVIFGRKDVPLGPDRIVLIPDRQLFHTAGTKARAKFWLAFSYSRRPVPRQSIPIELAPARTELSLMQDLIALLRPTWETADRNRVYHGSLALLHLVLSRPEIRWQSEAPDELVAVVRHIEEHYARPLYGADLARLAHMSESVFRKKFRYFRHVSPAQFIAQVRIREAAHLLATGLLDMSAIADRTGFPNPAYFSRVFKRWTGKTPARYRRESQNPAVLAESERSAKPGD